MTTQQRNVHNIYCYERSVHGVHARRPNEPAPRPAQHRPPFYSSRRDSPEARLPVCHMCLRTLPTHSDTPSFALTRQLKSRDRNKHPGATRKQAAKIVTGARTGRKQRQDLCASDTPQAKRASGACVPQPASRTVYQAAEPERTLASHDNLDFRGFDSSTFLILKGWNFQVHRELTRKIWTQRFMVCGLLVLRIDRGRPPGRRLPVCSWDCRSDRRSHGAEARPTRAALPRPCPKGESRIGDQKPAPLLHLIYLSIYLSLSLSIYLYIYMYICRCIHIYIYIYIPDMRPTNPNYYTFLSLHEFMFAHECLI